MQNSIKIAGKKDKSSTCSMHLLVSKVNDINKLFSEQKYYEILSILEELKNKYENDDKIIRLLAIASFRLLLNGEKYRSNNLLQFILDKAERNFFDPILCSYVVGILILIETATQPKIVKKIGIRMAKMSPGILKKILELLPENVFRPKIKKDLENLI